MGQLWARACGLGAQARLGEKFLQISFTLPPRGKKFRREGVRPQAYLRVGFFPHSEFAQRVMTLTERQLARSIRLHNSDCLVGMSRLGTGSVDLILCDLPYGTTNCPWDTVIPFEPLWGHYRRILKPRGAIVLFAAQPFATDLINSARSLFRYDLVWEKTAPVGYANSHKMPLRSHELVLVFYKQLPKYHPQGLVLLEKPIVRRGRATKQGGVYRGLEKESVQRFTNYPRSVLHFSNRRDRRVHPTQKPVALIEYLIRTYSDPEDLVVDNCMGSGTTAIACLNSGRRFVGFEMGKQYYDVACQRVAKWMPECV